MTLPDTLASFLAGHGIDFRVVSHDATPRIQQAVELAGVSPGLAARAVLLADQRGPHLVVLPVDRLLDFKQAEALVGGPVELAPPALAQRHFPDCHPQMTPAAGMAYGVPLAVDASLDGVDEIYMAVGRTDCLIRLSREAFARLFAGQPRGTLSRPMCEIVPAVEATEHSPYLPQEPDAKCLARLYALPPMPQSAMRIVQLRSDPDAGVDELAKVVGADPALAAQVMRFARSAFYGYRGEIKSVHDAIHRVLGFDVVANLALSLAAVRPLQVPEAGPLGLRAFWQHSLASGLLAQELARRMAPARRVKPPLAYLAALLHDIGFLVMGHLFRPEFAVLNRLASARPNIPVVQLEQQVLVVGQARQMVCMGHARMGAWLMHTWNMPAEVVTAMAEHHDPAYEGEHADYAGLVLLADRLLRRQSLGAGDTEDVPEELLKRLELRPELVEAVYEQVIAERTDLDALASMAST